MEPDALLGTWTLTRVVHDHRAGERRDVTGEATLVAESADRVFISINSVKTYIRSAYRKIGVTSRSQAVAWGLRNGLVHRPG